MPRMHIESATAWHGEILLERWQARLWLVATAGNTLPASLGIMTICLNLISWLD